MAYDMFNKVPVGDPARKDYIQDQLRKNLVWRNGQPRRAQGRPVDEMVALHREEVWDEVLDRIKHLRKDGPVGRDTLRKLRDENPYRS